MSSGSSAFRAFSALLITPFIPVVYRHCTTPYSYHIVKDGEFLWPLCPLGDYCIRETIARKELDNQIRENSSASSRFTLYRAGAIRNRWGKVIAITTEQLEDITVHGAFALHKTEMQGMQKRDESAIKLSLING